MCVANVINQILFGYQFDYDNCEKLKRFVNCAEEGLAAMRTQKIVFLAQAYPIVTKIPLIKYMGLGTAEETIRQVCSF